MARTSFEGLRVYRLSEELADAIWDMAVKWDRFARDTVGKQVVKSGDSIGANIAEGTGRGTYADNRRFAKIGRGSLYETKHWLRRAFKRKLMSTNQVSYIKTIVDKLGPSLNAYIKSSGSREAKTANQPLPKTATRPAETNTRSPNNDNSLLPTDHQ